MFANYNVSEFPKVEIVFEKTITDKADFVKFVTEWLKLYIRKKDFYFLMDTRKTGLVPIKYCFEMTKFINYIKRKNLEGLQYSIILVSSNLVLKLLKFIFFMSKPVAPIFIVKTKEDYNKLDYALENKEIIVDIDYSYVKSYKE